MTVRASLRRAAIRLYYQHMSRAALATTIKNCVLGYSESHVATRLYFNVTPAAPFSSAQI
jgi:hypothetical protein